MAHKSGFVNIIGNPNVGKSTIMNALVLMKKLFLPVLLSFTSLLNAQVSESCDCTVDTVGYANFLQTFSPSENDPFQFEVQGTFAVAHGVIDASTPGTVQNLIDNNPNVTTIIMYACPGSANDEANLQAAQLIYNHGYKMYLPQNGFIASGGTDMFLAGSTRVVEVTPQAVGVHSWAEDEAGNVTATDYPVGHAVHQPYIDYYIAIGFTQAEAEAFYYFTINSSPFTSVHWMTQAELDLYKVRTCKYSATPEYSVSVNNDILKADLDNKTYQWIDCSDNSEIANETNQTFNPTSNGTYAVIVNETGCSDTSACITISALSHEEFDFGVHLFTDQTTGVVHLSSTDTWSNLTISIYDHLGRKYNKQQFNYTPAIELNLPEQAGIYFIQIEKENRIKTYKVLKL